MYTPRLWRRPSPHTTTLLRNAPSPFSPTLVSEGSPHVLQYLCFWGMVIWSPMDTYSHLNPSWCPTHLAQLIGPGNKSVTQVWPISQLNWDISSYSWVKNKNKTQILLCVSKRGVSQPMAGGESFSDRMKLSGRKNRILRVLGAMEQLGPCSPRLANI